MTDRGQRQLVPTRFKLCKCKPAETSEETGNVTDLWISNRDLYSNKERRSQSYDDSRAKIRRDFLYF